MASTRIMLMGHGWCGERCLQALIAGRKEVIGLVIPGNRPEHKVGPIREIARSHYMPAFQPRDVNHPGFVETLRGLAPDLIISASFTQIFTGEVVRLPRLGCINVHGALLPQYRGLHAHNWAIINGEAETGATIHYVDEGVDTGDVVAQCRVRITDEDDAFTLMDKVTRQAAALVLEAVHRIEKGTVRRIKQDESKARYWPPRKPEDGLINWAKSSWEIFNLVRALVSPWPGAFTCFRGKKLLIWKATPVGEGTDGLTGALPGQQCGVSGQGFLVATGDGHLLVRKVQLAEGAPLLGTRFVEKYTLQPGESLGC